MPFPLIPILIAAFFVAAVLSFAEIKNWLTSNKDSYSSYAKLVKERLDNGNYQVVSGIFDESDELQTSKAWEGDELDEELEEEFDGAEIIEIGL